MSNRRLAIIASHPVQYQAPLFRVLAEDCGCDVCVYYGHIPNAERQGEGFGVAFEWDLPLLDGYPHRVFAESMVHGATPGTGAAAYRKLRRWIREQQPHAVLCTGWYHSSLFIGLAAARMSGAPCLLRCESNLLRKRALPARLFQRLMLSQFAGVLPIGQLNHSYYGAFGVADSKMFPAPYFVDNARFCAKAAGSDRLALRSRWKVPETGFCFLFAGKLERKKHPEMLLEAMVGIPSAHLLIVGSGPMEAGLRGMAARTGISCSFTGFLNQSEIPQAYAAADSLVLPSDSGETWGLVVNEGMACGLPAIVSDRVGCRPDLIVEGNTGLSFPFGDVAELRARMQELADDPAQAKEMGSRAKDLIQNYSAGAAAAGVLAALDAVARKRSIRPCAE